MDYAEYILKAERTAKKHDDEDISLLEYSIGMLGEIGELQEVIRDKADTPKKIMKLASEAGDILWYATMLQQALTIVPKYTDAFAEAKKYYNIGLNYVPEILIPASKVAEMVKHLIIHNQKIDLDKVQFELWLVMKNLHQLLLKYGTTLECVARLNIAKLEHRHKLQNGGSYSDIGVATRKESEENFSKTNTYKNLFKEITHSSYSKSYYD